MLPAIIAAGRNLQKSASDLRVRLRLSFCRTPESSRRHGPSPKRLDMTASRAAGRAACTASTGRRSTSAGVLLACAALASCTTSASHDGFGLQRLGQWPSCQVLTYRGEPVIRQVGQTERKSMWGLGKCPKTRPDHADTTIWVQKWIDVAPHVATMTTKIRDDGTYQRITIRRNYSLRQPNYFRYIWVRHKR